MTSVAERGDRRFNTADEAARAALRSAGLSHVAEKAASVAKAGVQKTEDGTYVLGWDTQTCRVGAFPMVDVLRGKGGASMTFARGQDDEAVSSSEIRSLGCDPIDIPGAGHNAHVEKPDAVWALFSQTQRQA
jgi:pimeloyl-ACP methyl ester carboxylesterase